MQAALPHCQRTVPAGLRLRQHQGALIVLLEVVGQIVEGQGRAQRQGVAGGDFNGIAALIENDGAVGGKRAGGAQSRPGGGIRVDQHLIARISQRTIRAYRQNASGYVDHRSCGDRARSPGQVGTQSKLLQHHRGAGCRRGIVQSQLIPRKGRIDGGQQLAQRDGAPAHRSHHRACGNACAKNIIADLVGRSRLPSGDRYGIAAN